MATLYESFTTNNFFVGGIWGDRWKCQTFTAIASYTVTSAKLKLYRTAGLDDTVTVSIRATTVNLGGDTVPTTTDLCSGTLATTSLTTDTNGDWYAFDFGAGTALTSGTVYAIVIRIAGGGVADSVGWRMDTDEGYTDGQFFRNHVAGHVSNNWDLEAYDGVFKNYALVPVGSATPVDRTFVKKLVAFANNKLFYET